jgi:hypothetical protein
MTFSAWLEQSWGISDLEIAIPLYRERLALMPARHPDQLVVFNNLTIALEKQAESNPSTTLPIR